MTTPHATLIKAAAVEIAAHIINQSNGMNSARYTELTVQMLREHNAQRTDALIGLMMAICEVAQLPAPDGLSPITDELLAPVLRELVTIGAAAQFMARAFPNPKEFLK